MWLKTSLVAVLPALLLGCQSTNQIDSDYLSNVQSPESWQYKYTKGDVSMNWLQQLTDSQVHGLVSIALENNLNLQRKSMDVETAQQQLIISGSALWPTLAAEMDNSRRKSTSEQYSTNHSLALKVSYELDLWGKLSDEARQANLNVMASMAEYKQQTHNLVADVVVSWFAVIEGKTQLSLLARRLEVVAQDLDIIESGYKQGLNSALDVYLARTELSNEQAKLAQQEVLVTTRIRNLERLVGEYPSGLLTINAQLPLLESTISLGVPSTLLTRKPALMASWYQLLAQDAALAYAHKQRFPSINISASYGPDGEQFSDAFSFSAAGWSLISGISAPLFNAGSLVAKEELARIELKSKELMYLNSLQDAFAAVENGISKEASLKIRYEETLVAQKNAQLAEQLSFEQYQKGLVSYTTVLDAQKRSFDAQSSLISIKNELIKNRVELHLALGGDFQQAEEVSNDIS
ncbi:TolC family protein [Pseudoalteromonas luteoviolacea]|uniref:TolC family protein n=1 Tax=Pseudoalteromonas luteoviolacea TaxID=43657 RepID=UPI001B3A2D73|nr:TolC family protein [Pseudoalteromonas luteoviolacea]MBQ4876533.1 TolC family protein [Pseudoalteromonas luteoviolacea]MBQ4905164.1 TolC family protein [Pseudoalteromonas luteoviolacea]